VYADDAASRESSFERKKEKKKKAMGIENFL
jgi:hypothetical protein